MSSFLSYARLVRLPNVFTAMADIALGTLAAGESAGGVLGFLCLLVASAGLYSSGMVWNDYFDLDQDRKERPFRPLPSGKITKRQAWIIGCGLMVFGLLLAMLADWVRAESAGWSFYLALGLALAILLYDGWFKRTWAGPLAMGLCRCLNVFLGLSAAATWTGWWGVALAAAVGSYVVGVTAFARTEARESSQGILAAAAGVMALGLVIGLTVPGLAVDADREPQTSFFFPYLLASFGIILAIPLLRAIRRPVPERVQAAVKRAVLGLIVLDAILATGLVGLLGLIILLLLPPAIFLGRWVYST